MTSGDRAAARELWLEARDLVPGQSEQYRLITARATALADDYQSSRPSTPGPSHKSWWTSAAGAAVAVGLLLAGKFKFLLLGLSKLSTVVSMFGFIAVYGSIHGWPLAVGLAGSIYVHEMGHVAMLRRLGIRADAPLFIPGVGALMMLERTRRRPRGQRSNWLGRPGVGIVCRHRLLGYVYLVTGASIWLAIAELTGFLNLFNLIPVSPRQLDGSRGFQVLDRDERWIVRTGGDWAGTLGNRRRGAVRLSAALRSITPSEVRQARDTAPQPLPSPVSCSHCRGWREL